MLPRIIVRLLKFTNSNCSRKTSICTDSLRNYSVSQLLSNEGCSVEKNIYPDIKHNASVLDIPFREPITHRLTKVISKEDINQFLFVLNDVIKQMTNSNDIFDFSQVKQWYTKVMLANVPSGQENPGLTTVVTYKLLEKPENLTEEKIKLAHILGIIMDMWHMAMNIHDDFLDSSTLRKGFPCWYRFKNVGRYVLRDSIAIENTIYAILQKYFRDHPCYIHCHTMLREFTFHAIQGQALDLKGNKIEMSNIDCYTLETFDLITKYKIHNFTFYMPLSSAMYLANIFDEDIHRQVQKLCTHMCVYNAVENDYLDCFGDTKIFGKEIGSDIREGKCTWLIATAVTKATPAQKKIIWEHIGRPEDEHVNTLIDLFKEMGLEEDFDKYRKESYEKAGRDIENFPDSLSKEAFYVTREIVYNRFYD